MYLENPSIGKLSMLGKTRASTRRSYDLKAQKEILMKYHYDLYNSEAIVRDVPAYDAATLVQGEYLMLDPAAATDCRFITAYAGDATEALDGIGICNETVTTTSKADRGDAITTAATATTDAISSIAATLAQGHRYVKAIINPFAVYLAEYSQAAADDVALTQAWSTTTLTLTSLEDNIDGGWVFGASQSATSGFAGQLRYLTASAAGSCTVDSAPTVAGTTNDTIVKVLPIAHRLVGLNAGATDLISTAAASSTVSLCIVENYIGGRDRALEPLRAEIHEGVDYGSNAKVYADIISINHLWNPLS
jgi:hypothetical protein